MVFDEIGFVVTRIDDKILLRRYHENGDLQARAVEVHDLDLDALLRQLDVGRHLGDGRARRDRV